jgi:pyruvate dehydrogenase E2 component (dihydrolipoamide acetyltransferase)
MASFEFKLPDIGEGVTEGEVVAWHVKEGDRVAEDQVMVEVMTDKATVTIGAPRAGKIEKLHAAVGAVIQVGDVLVVISSGNGSRVQGQLPAATAVGDIRESLPGTGHFGEKRAGEAVVAHAAEPVKGKAGQPQEKPLATPATRKLARDLIVDLRSVAGSGPGGRVTRDDVITHSTSASGTLQSPLPAHARARGPAAPPTSAAKTAPRAAQPAAGTRVPFVGIRRRIAENMSASKNTAAHFTFVEECEVDRLIELRERLSADAEAAGAKLTYLAFAIKAVVGALKKHPALNSSLDTATSELVLHGHYHIGIAAATDQGLVVPVVRDADQRSLLELALEVERLGRGARDGTLSREELTGSTFTITSLGKQAGLFAVPIINLPNVGILGLHRMKERPVVRDGKIAIGNVMLLSLSLDHRIVDGHVGAAFAYDVIRYLEEPARLLLEG